VDQVLCWTRSRKDAPTGQAGSLHIERVVARPLATSSNTEPFQIELRQSRLTLTVPPELSILKVVEEAGHPRAVVVRRMHGRHLRNGRPREPPEHRDSILDADHRSANDCINDLRIALPRPPHRLMLDL
jgi:hypothetical protein